MLDGLLNAFDLRAVPEQTPGALGLVVEVRAVNEGIDAQPDEEDLAVLHQRVGVGEADAAVAQRLHLGAGQLDAGLEGVDSGDLLRRVLEMLPEAGLAIGNLDATVIAQEPRLAPHLAKLRSSVAGLLDAPEDRVNVKVTSTDQLGAIGRGEGIAAQAVVLLESR